MKRRAILFWILVPLYSVLIPLLVSCLKSEPAIKQLPLKPADPALTVSNFDPIKSFNVIISNLRLNLAALKQAALRENPELEAEDLISYDIKKTSSIINPLVGEVNLKRTKKSVTTLGGKPFGPATILEYEARFTLDGEKWVLLSLSSISESYLISNGGTKRLNSGDSNVETMQKIYPNSETWIEIEKLFFGDLTKEPSLKPSARIEAPEAVVPRSAPLLAKQVDTETLRKLQQQTALHKQQTRPGVFSDNKFGTTDIGPTAIDAKWSNYGVYLQRMIETVQIQWDRILLSSSESESPPSGTTIILSFKMDSDGKITSITDLKNPSTDQGKEACVSAIKARSPYGKWSDDMVSVLGESQNITLTFYYR